MGIEGTVEGLIEATIENSGAEKAPAIFFPSKTIPSTSIVGADVGSASILGIYTGTPTWSLTDDASGKFAINGSTGAVTVAGALTSGDQLITISVAGTTPAPPQASFFIVVSA
ncbi:MAG: hypothetical protein KGL39_06415 [Patescibacteria group bacterium]|nr:hypothetical protein [Patescibacteria group bacterium]